MLLIVAWLSAIQLNTDFNEARTVYLTSRGENGAHVPVAAAPRSETPVDGKLVTVRPKATDEVILNPGKGWVLYGLPTWKSPEVLAMGTVGYTRLDWAIIEPEEGKLNWQELDQHITSWAAVGKQSAFGVMCANSHSTRPYVTPKWVFDAGARNRKVELVNPESHNGTPGEKVVPVFDDPIFLQKLRAFVTALGERYDGNSNIAYVDIRSYGNWGEGHMWPFKGDHISADSLKEHISIYTEAFPATQLILPWGERDFEPVYEWAVRQGVGMRRDGICGNGDGAETARALGREPAVFEFFGPYGFLKKTGLWDGKGQNGWGFPLADCVERGHPSYVSLSQWGTESEQFLKAERPLIERLANRMGYHFVLEQARFPSKWTHSQSQEVRFRWRNDGVAPVYVPCVVALVVMNEADKLVDVCSPAECHPGRWLEGTTNETVRVQFDRTTHAGRYRLGLGLVRQIGDREPAFQLGIDLPRVRGWYVLGEIVVE